MSGFLEGMRVLDLSRVLAGPFAAQIMAEMGADVIKVEFPRGDPARAIGPHVDGRSLYFSSLNTGKRGIVLDPDAPADREALDALMARSDVVVENFRPTTGARLGLAPEDLLTTYPRLVVVSVRGYARDSDRADEGAFDLTIQAEAGIMAVTGTGEPGAAPVRAGVPLSDLAAALWAALGATGALLARERSGRGRHVEVPMVDSTLPLLSYVATTALATGEEPPRVGSGHHSLCPYGAFPTSDGWIVIAVLSDKFWPPLCHALGLEELAGRPELAANDGRMAVRAEVDAAIAGVTGEMATGEAVARLGRARVPHASVMGVIEALQTPYVRDRGIVSSVPAPEGPYPLVRGPLRSDPPLRPAPAMGEHTREVLEEVLGAGHPLLRRIRTTAP